MFKKVFLSSLLPVAMTFSMGVTVRAELSDGEICKGFCEKTKEKVHEYDEEIKKIKKAINAKNSKIYKLWGHYYDFLSSHVLEKGFDEEAEKKWRNNLNNSVNIVEKEIEYDKSKIYITEMVIKELGENYKKVCPKDLCEVNCTENKGNVWKNLKDCFLSFFNYN